MAAVFQNNSAYNSLFYPTFSHLLANSSTTAVQNQQILAANKAAV